MGYYIRSKKIVLSLDLIQQQELIKIWNEISFIKGDVTFVEMLAEQYSYIDYKENQKKDKLKITKLEGKLRSNSLKFWQKVAHIITPGSYITWRGEDGDLFGTFFNGTTEVDDYTSYEQLHELLEKFKLNKKLTKELPQKRIMKQNKI